MVFLNRTTCINKVAGGHGLVRLGKSARQVASWFDLSVSMAAATSKPFSRSIPSTSYARHEAMLANIMTHRASAQ